MIEIKCAICGGKASGDPPFKFDDELYRCVKCAAAYFFEALDRNEEDKAWSALTSGFDSRRRCVEKEKTAENQKRLEDLFLCAKVVKVESATVYGEESRSKLKIITLLCSDDKTLIHVRGEVDDEDYSERTTYKDMIFQTEELEKSKKRK